jgi:hypothetical protein
MKNATDDGRLFIGMTWLGLSGQSPARFSHMRLARQRSGADASEVFHSMREIPKSKIQNPKPK